MLKNGTILRGSKNDYCVDAPVGQGGASIVYRVVDLKSGKFFAAKLLSFHRFPSEVLKSRFEKEILIHQRLQHPNVIRFHEVIETESGPVLISEYAFAGSLYERLAGQSTNAKSLPVAKVIGWAWYIARGLSCLHAHNIIHRDLTPRNILFRKDDLPAIADFGISRHAEDPTLTHSHERLGSLIYISPQQRDDPHQADPQDDVFSLGQILYQVATGIIPHGNPPPLNSVRPDFPAAVASLIERMRSFGKQDRPKNGDEVLKAMEIAALDSHRDLHTADNFPLAMIMHAPDGSKGALETLLSLGMFDSWGKMNLLDESRENIQSVATTLAARDDDPLLLNGLEEKRQFEAVSHFMNQLAKLYGAWPFAEQQEFRCRRVKLMKTDPDSYERVRALAGACKVALFRPGVWEGWLGRIQDLAKSGVGLLSPIDAGVNTWSFRPLVDSERTDDLVGSGHAWLVNTNGCAELIQLYWGDSIVIRDAYDQLESGFIAQQPTGAQIEDRLAEFLTLVQRVSIEGTWCPVQAAQIPRLLEEVDNLMRDHENADVSDG